MRIFMAKVFAVGAYAMWIMSVFGRISISDGYYSILFAVMFGFVCGTMLGAE